MTVTFDSLLWQRWLWPEAEVLWFNTYQNRSHEWGVAPFYWYFASALPRALLGTILLVPFGLVSTSPSTKAIKHFFQNPCLVSPIDSRLFIMVSFFLFQPLSSPKLIDDTRSCQC